MKGLAVILIIANLLALASSAGLTAGNLLVIRSQGTQGAWNPVYIEEINIDGTPVQTLDPSCYLNDYYAGSIVYNQDYTVAASFACKPNQGSTPTSTTPFQAIALKSDGTLDTTTVTTLTDSLATSALIDGRNVWIGTHSGLAFTTRGTTGPALKNNSINAGNIPIFKAQMVSNAFYVGGNSSNPFVATVDGGAPTSLTTTPSVTTVLSQADVPAQSKSWFVYSASEIYGTSEDVATSLFKMTKVGSAWNKFIITVPNGALGVTAVDINSKRMVYFTSREKLYSCEDTGSAFTTLTTVKSYVGSLVHDVVYIRSPLANCSDSAQNQDESDVDCATCADTQRCNIDADCTNKWCNASNICATPTCSDGFKNQDETDVDCGGNTCSANKCTDGKTCLADTDCVSKYCNPLGKCCRYHFSKIQPSSATAKTAVTYPDYLAVPSCTDGWKNEYEMDVDCGNYCPLCADGKHCTTFYYCNSSYCNPNGYCSTPSCYDGFKNQDETDVDCGGKCSAVNKCATGSSCLLDSDCSSGVCLDHTICQAPTCFDNVKNQNETATDCGGVCGATCLIGMNCLVHGDCASRRCENNTCEAATCSDSLADGDETDVDCGGNTCPKYAIDKHCLNNTDCETDLCVAGLCTAPSCTDDIMNQNETDVDCGGVCGATCSVDASCLRNADCVSNLCANSTCAPIPEPINTPISTSPAGQSTPRSIVSKASYIFDGLALILGLLFYTVLIH